MVLPGSPFLLRSSDFDGYQDRCCRQRLRELDQIVKSFFLNQLNTRWIKISQLAPHQRFLTIHISSQISCNCLFIVFMALCHECERSAFPAPFMTNSWRSLPQFILHLKHGISWSVTSGREITSSQPSFITFLHYVFTAVFANSKNEPFGRSDIANSISREEFGRHHNGEMRHTAAI